MPSEPSFRITVTVTADSDEDAHSVAQRLRGLVTSVLHDMGVVVDVTGARCDADPDALGSAPPPKITPPAGAP